MSDELRHVVTLVLPHNLRLKLLELSGFFERTHQEFVAWFIERIRDIGGRYLRSAGGKTWKDAYLKAKYDNLPTIYYMRLLMLAQVWKEEQTGASDLWA